jgi:hypothetical protein
VQLGSLNPIDDNHRYYGKARRDVGEPAASLAWREGQAMSFDDAVTQALACTTSP